MDYSEAPMPTKGPEFFHLAPNKLSVGTIIYPNFGPIIGRAGWLHNLAQREAALETARLALFSDRPSRLECTFACPSHATAVTWRQTIPASYQFHTIYRVEPLDPLAKTFETDQAFLNIFGPFRPHWGDLYWMTSDDRQAKLRDWKVQPQNPLREVLIDCPLRILEDMDDTAEAATAGSSAI